ncbi:MAG: CCA tRNA nucleotidyltransferase [Erysipelotrichaceae bacterium]|jgi:tRNA nucleotidyltransferase (CCA-adding enzyme)|nr:CCA tRNA nucleotidyltransferase [Bacillota bacterium]NLP21940.1 CCA tRNA nucleotidyltransferase [Erysipelotrichaceae bacterium]
MIVLPTYINKCINILNSSGFECFVVGGAIRDALLNREVNDYDITTNATPIEIKEAFNDFKTIETGIKHGTLTVIIDYHHIEITTYRIDGEYEDNRHPNNVVFTQSIYEDCKRRDFTINAICFHPQTGILDFFDGVKDLNNKIIRSIDNPDKRFNEDALRIIRALRFSCELDFEIEENTKKSILNNKDLLNNIAIERISDELDKIFSTSNSYKIFKEYFEVFTTIIPEFKNITNKEEVIHNLSKQSSSDIKLAIILLNIKDDALNIMNQLKLPNITKRKIKFLLNNYDIDLEDKTNIKKILNINKEFLNDLITFIKIIKPETNINKINQLHNEIIHNKEPYKLSHLDINGNDLIELGIKDFKISLTLNDILNKVIDNTLENDKEIIIEHIKKGDY